MRSTSPSPVDEFMLVLAGSVNIVYADGTEDIFRTGDAFVIPKGLNCQWKQTESIHKVYVILDDPKSPMPEKPVSERAVRLTPHGPEGIGLSQLELPNPENFEGGTPTQYDHTTLRTRPVVSSREPGPAVRCGARPSVSVAMN